MWWFTTKALLESTTRVLYEKRKVFNSHLGLQNTNKCSIEWRSLLKSNQITGVIFMSNHAGKSTRHWLTMVGNYHYRSCLSFIGNIFILLKPNVQHSIYTWCNPQKQNLTNYNHVLHLLNTEFVIECILETSFFPSDVHVYGTCTKHIYMYM